MTVTNVFLSAVCRTQCGPHRTQCGPHRTQCGPHRTQCGPHRTESYSSDTTLHKAILLCHSVATPCALNRRYRRTDYSTHAEGYPIISWCVLFCSEHEDDMPEVETFSYNENRTILFDYKSLAEQNAVESGLYIVDTAGHPTINCVL